MAGLVKLPVCLSGLPAQRCCHRRLPPLPCDRPTSALASFQCHSRYALRCGDFHTMTRAGHGMPLLSCNLINHKLVTRRKPSHRPSVTHDALRFITFWPRPASCAPRRKRKDSAGPRQSSAALPLLMYLPLSLFRLFGRDMGCFRAANLTRTGPYTSSPPS